jgi:hypothetical protein
MRDDSMSLGADPALYTDRCLADELIRFVEQRALAELGSDQAASD